MQPIARLQGSKFREGSHWGPRLPDTSVITLSKLGAAEFEAEVTIFCLLTVKNVSGECSRRERAARHTLTHRHRCSVSSGQKGEALRQAGACKQGCQGIHRNETYLTCRDLISQLDFGFVCKKCENALSDYICFQ